MATGTDASIIPSLLLDSVKRLPTRARVYALNFSQEATTEEVVSIFDTLLTQEKQMNVITRFWLGDIYNQVRKTRRAPNLLLQPIYDKFGDKYRQLLRTYGWVANKWPEKLRNDLKPWSYWVKYSPNGLPSRAVDKQPVSLTLLEQEELPDGEVMLTYEDPKGRKYTARAITYKREPGYGAEMMKEEVTT